MVPSEVRAVESAAAVVDEPPAEELDVALDGPVP
jgi:hypothetical protein